jgi:hypothetical protein
MILFPFNCQFAVNTMIEPSPITDAHHHAPSFNLASPIHSDLLGVHCTRASLITPHPILLHTFASFPSIYTIHRSFMSDAHQLRCSPLERSYPQSPLKEYYLAERNVKITFHWSSLPIDQPSCFLSLEILSRISHMLGSKELKVISSKMSFSLQQANTNAKAKAMP